jgi:hypothetical protein
VLRDTKELKGFKGSKATKESKAIKVFQGILVPMERRGIKVIMDHRVYTEAIVKNSTGQLLL